MYDSKIIRACVRLCCSVLLVFACAPPAIGGGTIYIQNLGPCTATNVYALTVVTEQVIAAGTLANTEVGPLGSPLGGGNYGLTNGQIVVIRATGLSPGNSFRANVFIREGSGGYHNVGNVQTTSTLDVTKGFFPSCGTTNPACITNSLSRTVLNRAQMYGIAVFEMDGVMVFTQVLAPGASVSYTFEWCRMIFEDAPTLHYGMSYTESAIIGADGVYEVVQNETTQGTTPSLNSTNAMGLSGTQDGYASTNQPFQGSLTNSTATGLTNSYPINWNNGDTTAARDATLRAGFNKLAQQNESVINGLARMGDGSGGGGGTNVIVLTNAVGLTSNELWSAESQVASQFGTNLSAFTNFGASYGSAVGGAWSNMVSGGLMGFTDGDGPDEESYIPLPVQYTGTAEFRIKPSLVTSNPIFALARNLCKWFIVGMTIYAMFCWAEKAVHKLFEQRQVQGNNQLIAGFNINAPSALAYAAIIATTIAAVPLVLGVFMADSKAELAALAGAPAAVTALVGWTYANAIIPVGVMITSFITYCTFRFLLGMPLLSVARFILVMLAG